MSWATVKLAEVASIERKGIDPSAIESGTNYLGLEHIKSGGDIISRQKVENGELGSTKFSFGPAHILYGKLRPYLAKIALPDFDGICSTDILPIKPGPKIDRKYLAFFLRQPSMIDLATSRSSGANLPRLSPKALSDFDIPLPPLKEQQRIATILDQTNVLRVLRQRSTDELDRLESAVFYDVFGDPANGEVRWPKGTLRELMNEVRYGTAKKAHTERRGVPILRMGNITYSGKLDLIDLKYVDLSDSEKPKYTVRSGDIIFNRTNSKELVGKTAVYDLPEEMAIAGYLIRARVNEDIADPYFISGYLNSPYGKATLKAMCKNIIGMANINAQEFQDIELAIPDIATQKQYRRRIENIDNQRRSLEWSLIELDNLFKVLQQRAFRGEL